eukprot:s1542_g23.t1
MNFWLKETHIWVTSKDSQLVNVHANLENFEELSLFNSAWLGAIGSQLLKIGTSLPPNWGVEPAWIVTRNVPATACSACSFTPMRCKLIGSTTHELPFGGNLILKHNQRSNINQSSEFEFVTNARVNKSALKVP